MLKQKCWKTSERSPENYCSSRALDNKAWLYRNEDIQNIQKWGVVQDFLTIPVRFDPNVKQSQISKWQHYITFKCKNKNVKFGGKKHLNITVRFQYNVAFFLKQCWKQPQISNMGNNIWYSGHEQCGLCIFKELVQLNVCLL